MDLKKELKGRTWPTRPEKSFFSLDTLYVREGRLFNRALQLQQDLSEPIPPGECAITSLVAGGDDRIVGATSGRRSHLFVYSPGPHSDGVFDIGVIEGATAVRNSLVVTRDRVVFGGVSAALDPEAGGGLFRFPKRGEEFPPGRRAHKHKHKPKSHLGHAWRPRIETLCVPVAGECVSALVGDEDRGVLYGLSSERGTLFSYDIASDAVNVIGAVAEEGNYSRALVVDRDGRVWGAGPCGRLFVYDRITDQIEHLDLSLPTVAGREFYNRLDAVALDPVTGLVYGGGSADGVLFVFDPDRRTIRSLGKVLAEPRCRCITVGLDGRVYGVAGEPDGMGHLFCYDPGTHELRDLGVPYANSERVWHGYEFEAACTGPNGEIYLGESDRISHLWIYFPPIRSRAPEIDDIPF